MKRTYNTFVDNGLFIAERLLNKEYEEITFNDLKDNLDIFTEKIYDFITCDKYSKIGGMAFHNSAYNQPAYRDCRQEKIKYQYEILLKNIGNEVHCSICGEKNIKVTDAADEYINLINRSFMPNIVAHTFYNNSNNLQTVNICPVCIFLSMISTLNMRKSGNLILYLSESNDFMREYTYRRIQEYTRDIISKAPLENKGNTLNIQEEILDLILNTKYLYEKSIEVCVFNNSGQSQTYEEQILNKNNLELFYEIEQNNLKQEFNKLNLFSLMLQDSLKYRYIDYLKNDRLQKINCSKELFELIEKGVALLDENVLKLIKEVCEKIENINTKDSIKQLKEIKNYSDFEDLLISWQGLYKDKTEENLIESQDDLNKFLNYRKWRSISKRMLFQFYLDK